MMQMSHPAHPVARGVRSTSGVRIRRPCMPDLAPARAQITPPAAAWHARSVDDVAAELGTDLENGLSPDGLPDRPADDSPDADARGASRIFWNQLKGGVILVLIAATAVMLALGHVGDALAIGASVVFSVVFGFITDFRAERALDALRTLSAPTARVVRGGLEREIPAEDLRPGDLLVLMGGQIVAADGRIAVAHDLQADESALTGESVPVDEVAGTGRGGPSPAGPDFDGLGRHDRRQRLWTDGGDGDRRRYRAGPHREARRGPGPRGDTAREAGRAARPPARAPRDRALGPRDGPRPPARAPLLAHARDGRDPRDRRHPRGPPRRHDDRAGRRRPAHGEGGQPRETALRGRDAGVHVRHLHGQDRHAHGERHARDARRPRRAHARRHGRPLRPGRRIPRGRQTCAAGERSRTTAGDRRRVQRRDARGPRRLARPRLVHGRSSSRPRGQGRDRLLALRASGRDRVLVRAQAHVRRRTRPRRPALVLRQGLSREPRRARHERSHRWRRGAARRTGPRAPARLRSRSRRVGSPRPRPRVPAPGPRRRRRGRRRRAHVGGARRPHRPAAGERPRRDRGTPRGRHPDRHGDRRPEGHGDGRREDARDRGPGRPLSRLGRARPVSRGAPVGGPAPDRRLRARHAGGQAHDRPRAP